MGHTNSLLRKLPTWSVDEGPPMFMNTIAVGPLALMLFCVTGGATVAMDFEDPHCNDVRAVDGRVKELGATLRTSCAAG